MDREQRNQKQKNQERKAMGQPEQEKMNPGWGEQEKVNLEMILAEGQSVQFSTQGYSMYPFLNPQKGDQVIVEPLRGKKIRRGDVVLYRRDGEKGSTDDEGFARGILVLHRVYRHKGQELYLVGDNQNQIEGPLREDQVRGIMIARIRKGKSLSVKNMFYRLSTGLWLLVCPIRPKLMRIAEIVKHVVVK